MKPLRPSRNRQTQGYHSGHPAYDFSAKYDSNVYASNDGVVVQTVNKYTSAWVQGHEPDPTPDRLTTEDYGNYKKVRHDDGSYALYAHLSRNGVQVQVGQRVKRGQIIGTIGHTGNSTAPHLHFEYRNPANQAVSVDFDTSEDAYQANTPDPIPEKPKEDMSVQPLLDKYNVHSLQELDDKIEQHVGTDWNSGYLGGDRKKVEELKGKLLEATSYAEDLAKKGTQCFSELETQDGIIEALETENKQLTTANGLFQTNNKQLHAQVETLFSENEKIRQELEESRVPKVSKELNALLIRLIQFARSMMTRKFAIAVVSSIFAYTQMASDGSLAPYDWMVVLTPLLAFMGIEGVIDARKSK